MPCARRRWRGAACPWTALVCLMLLCPHRARSHVDNCNWKGSGLTETLIAPGAASIVQLSLRCTQGSLEWLYPSGALRVLLHAPAAAAAGGRLLVCLKPMPGSRGANVYVERPGELELVVDEASASSERVYCVPAGRGERDAGAATALFIQAVPQTDISRKVTALRYELRSGGAQVVVPGRDARSADDACRPCSDAEMLMSACVSDFVAKGEITSVSHDKGEDQSIIRVSVVKVFQQKEEIFQQQRTVGDETRTLEDRQQRTLGDEPRMLGELRTPLRCGVKRGEGAFLFTGGLHFGQAWLGCAPWYEAFRRAYEHARATGDNPCELRLD